MGSVLRQCCDESDDESDSDFEDTIFGLTTLISISKERSKESVNEIKSFILEKANELLSQNDYKSLRSILDVKNIVGFLINERFINIPSNIAPPLFKSLYEENLVRSTYDEQYSFDYIFTILKLHKDGNAKEVIFANEEEEILDSKADYSFEYSVRDESDTAVSENWNITEGDAELIPYRRVIVFKGEHFKEIVDKIQTI